jgi:hypothetical protein
MARFFPRQTVAWHVEEPAALRRFSLSLVAMAIATGVTVRVVRWLTLRYGPGGTWWFLFIIALLWVLVLTGATLYLGNYPVRHWLWRAPLFAVLESLAELGTSAVLIAFALERSGSDLADWNDLRSEAAERVLVHFIIVCAFAGILAAVVQTVRYRMLKAEHRDSTAIAIHEEHVREEQAKEIE